MATFARGHHARHTRQANTRNFKRINYTPETDIQLELRESDPRHLIILQLVSRDGNQCYLCRQTYPLPAYEVDHIIARSHGGPNQLHNYALACATCNRCKNNLIISFTTSDHTPLLRLPT